MGVRVWGVVGDRLIEVRVEPAEGDAELRIEGLPADRTRTAADRVRAALLNSDLVPRVPSVLLRLRPAIPTGNTSDLDLPLALAVLAFARVITSRLRWILATGGLGLDGTLYGADLTDGVTLADVVGSLCRSSAPLGSPA